MVNSHVANKLIHHAYCIIAHNEPEILRTLVRMVDDERNDIFIHIDAKSDMSLFTQVMAVKSRIVWTSRVKTYWGGPSQINAEKTVLSAAHDVGGYSRYHLISGVDLPIKSQSYIHDFCDNQYPSKEFVGFDGAADNSPAFREQWLRYIILGDYVRSANPLLRKSCSLLRHLCIAVQKWIGYKRRPQFEVKKGTNWVSLTAPMVDWLLLNRDARAIFDFLQHAHCADEKWIQTAVWNSPYRDNIFDLNSEMHGCMREIDWTRGNPYVWRMSDLPLLQQSESLFARKFSSGDFKIIRAIERSVLKSGNGNDSMA